MLYNLTVLHGMFLQDVSDYVRGWRRAQAFFVRMLSMDDWMNHDLPEQ